MKKIILVVLCVALVFTLISCVPAAPVEEPQTPPAALETLQAEDPEELQKVVLSEVTHSVFYAPQYAAIELGFFEEEGLEIELINGGGADNVMTAVLAGQADIGLAGPEASIYVHLEGRADYPVVFCGLTKRDGSFLVGREDVEFDWSQTVGTEILGGRKGGVPEMTLEYVMKQNGVEPHVDAQVNTAVEFSMMAGAFTGGQGDYVALFEPTASMVEAEGQGYVLTSLGQESGELPYTAYFANNSLLEQDPELLQKFTNAVVKGLEWVSENDAKTVAEAIISQFPDTSMEIMETVVQRYKDIDAWKVDGTIAEEELDRLQDIMEEAGELDARADYSKLVNNEFANNVK